MGGDTTATAPPRATVTTELKTLSPEEVLEIKEIFALVDTNGNGTISREELETLMRQIGMEPSQAEIENLVAEINFHGKEETTFDEFLTAMSRKVETSATPELLKWAFRKFQGPGSGPGLIYVRDVITALTEYGAPGKRMSRDDALSLIQQVAPNLKMNDQFDFNAFIDMMNNM